MNGEHRNLDMNEPISRRWGIPNPRWCPACGGVTWPVNGWPVEEPRVCVNCHQAHSEEPTKADIARWNAEEREARSWKKMTWAVMGARGRARCSVSWDAAVLEATA